MKPTNNLYIDISNTDGKRWLFPIKGIKKGLSLYQPSSLKGILLKSFLPVIIKIPIIRNILLSIINGKIIKYSISDNFESEIRKTFGLNDIEIQLAFFYGTPGKHIKQTIQVVANNKIYGYVKLSKNEDVIRLFEHEKKILDCLNNCAVERVPHCCIRKIDDDYTIFVQDTVKTEKSKIYHQLSKNHLSFLEKLKIQTSVKCSFINSDYGRMIENLKLLIEYYKDNQLTKQELEYIKTSIRIVEKQLQNTNLFCVFHGDFTPWNSFIEEKEIFVFDFEYAKFTYPPYLDVFHFIIQSSIYERNNNALQIMEKIENNYYHELELLFINPYISLLEYLLSSIDFYLVREKDKFDDSSFKEMKIRIELIKLTLSKIEE